MANFRWIVYYNRDVKDGYFISYKCGEDSLYSTKHIGLYKKDIPSGRWFFFYDDTPMKGVAFTLSEISENLDFPDQAFEMQAFM